MPFSARCEYISLEKRHFGLFYHKHHLAPGFRGPESLCFEREALSYFRRLPRARADRRQRDLLTRQVRLNASGRFLVGVIAYAGEPNLGTAIRRVAEQAVRQGFHLLVFFNDYGRSRSRPTFRKNWEKARLDLGDEFRNSVTWVRGFGYKRFPIGKIRGLFYDALVSGALQQRIEDPVLVCLDSDLLKLDETYFPTVVRAFERNPLPDLLVGPVRYCDELFTSEDDTDCVPPELLLNDRLNQVCLERLREGRPHGPRILHVEGANMVFRLASYCAANGCNYRLKQGCDDDLGYRLKYLRFSDGYDTRESRRYVCFEPDLALTTNPRRVLQALLHGRPMVDTWSWESFHASIGSDMDLPTLLRAYEIHPGLMQWGHVRTMDSDGSETMEHVRSRILFIFFYSMMRLSYLWDVESVLDIAKAFGLEIRNLQIEEETRRFSGASINWASSKILTWLKVRVPSAPRSAPLLSSN